MVNSNQKKRINRQRYIFVLACLASLIGLVFYIFGRYKISFPNQWLPEINHKDNVVAKNSKLFFIGISANLQVNFILGLFFMLINPEKMDPVKVKKWRYWIGKGLTFIFSLGYGLVHFGEALGKNNKIGNILLLCLIIAVINCCLLELLIQLMNQYGICNAFNLILFSEFLPLSWLQSQWNQQKFLDLFFLLVVTVFFIWITSLKWEVPIDINTLYSQESKILKKKSFKFGFKLGFSFMPLIYLSQFISFFYSLYLMKGETNWISFKDITKNWNKAQKEKRDTNLKSLDGKNSFWNSLFILNESKRIFQWKNVTEWFQKSWWVVVSALFFLVLLRWLVVWLQMRQGQWKTGEVSKELQQKGIYINHIPPGRSTSNLLKIVINKMVLLWNVIILVFNFVFDNLFLSLLTFSNWFGGVNIGVDLINQIRTKYRYIRTNK